MRIRNFPSCVFYDLLPEGSVSEDRQTGVDLAKRIREADAKREAIDMGHANAVLYFPLALYQLGPAALRIAEIRPLVMSDPLACTVLLLTYYEATAEILEPVVMGNGEVIYTLLRWAEAAGATLRLPRAAYEKALTRDPFWGILYGRQTKNRAVVDECVRFAHENHQDNAGAAYLFLYLHEKEDVRAYTTILATDPLYACLASKRLATRGLRIKASQIKGLTPRWAFHCLADGIIDDEKMLLDSLYMDPAWGLEWLKRSGELKTTSGIKRSIPPLLERAQKTAHPYLEACCNYVSRAMRNAKAGEPANA